MSRSSAGPCALRLSCVSLRGFVQHGIRELICVRSAARVRSCSPPSLSSRVFLQSLGRSSFFCHCCVFCGVPQTCHRDPLRGSRRRNTLCLIHLPRVSACSATLCIWFYVSVIGGYRSLRFEEFCREEKFKTSSPVAAHPSRALIKSLSELIRMSAPSLDFSLMGRAPLQLKGCPIVYLLKFTHYAIGSVAVLFLHPRARPPLQHISAVWSCCYRLAPSGRPLRLRVAPRSSTWLRGRWYVSAAPATVQPRTLFPTSWTSGSTLLRFPRESGACWWMPAGDCVCLPVLLCAVSRSCVPLYVPPW